MKVYFDVLDVVSPTISLTSPVQFTFNADGARLHRDQAGPEEAWTDQKDETVFPAKARTCNADCRQWRSHGHLSRPRCNRQKEQIMKELISVTCPGVGGARPGPHDMPAPPKSSDEYRRRHRLTHTLYARWYLDSIRGRFSGGGDCLPLAHTR